MSEPDFIEHLTDSPVCVFAFASGDMKRFEWGRTLRAMGVAHVLLRDSTGGWYLNGVAGIGHRWRVVARMLTVASAYERTMALGLSGGAYGAILYGSLANLDAVVAISPVTGAGDGIGVPHEFRHRVEQRPGDPVLDDLARLARAPRTKVGCIVSDGEGTELDRFMAERINPWGITIIPGHSHAGLAAHVRDSGVLKERIWPTLKNTSSPARLGS